MPFDYVGEVLHHPHHRFKLEEKQLAITATIVLLWMQWEQDIVGLVESNDIANMYNTTLQRERATTALLELDTGVFGRA